MRQIAKVLAVLFALLPGIAAAQQTLPANTVWGRLGIPTNGGPAQAIPFATLFANAGLAAGPQSCSSHNWFNSLNTGGVLGCAQPSFADLSSTIAAAQLIPPTGTTLGGVQSKDCSSGSQFLQKINTDGTITCATPSGAGTVTEQKNTVTANNGLTQSGNCDNTSSNASSPCNTAMNLDSAVLEVDSGLGTTVTNNTMMGWGVTSCRITPKYSSRLWVEVTAVIAETATTSFTIVLHFGTGTGPSQGAASAGTVIGSTAFVNGAATMSVPAKIGGIITGLTPGTAVWIDGLVSFTTADGSIGNIGCRAHEIM